MSGPLPLAHANSVLRPSLKNMFILSSAPSPSPTFSVTPSPTPPFPTFNFLSVSLPPRSTSRRSLASSCSLYSLKVTAKKDVVMDKDSPPENLATSVSYRTFLSARTEQELLSGIRKEAEAGSLPFNVAAAMEELYQNYKNAVFQSGDPRADEIVLSNMTVALDRIFLDVGMWWILLSLNRNTRQSESLLTTTCLVKIIFVL